MSKMKQNKLLVPLISARESKLKPARDSKQLKETERKKELLMKAYDNDRVVLPRNRFRKQDARVAVSFQERDGSILGASANYRYGIPKADISEYLQQGRLPGPFGRSYIQRSSRPRPGSLFKIAEKSSVAEIRPKHTRHDRSQSNIEMSENHSVDLFKIKQGNQRRFSVHPQASNSKTKDLLEEGRRLYREGNHEQARKYFEEVVDEQPNQLEALYFMSVIALNGKQFQLAERYLGEILRQKVDYKKSAYLFMCITLKNLAKREEAVLMASQGLAHFPHYFDLLIYRAKLYQADGLFDLAEKDYDAALAMKDDNAQAYFKRGQCYLQMKEWKKAVTSLTTAAYLDQGFKLKCLQERARAYLELHNLPDARKDIDKLIAADSESSENFELRGLLQAKENQTAEAILSFEQCIKNNTSKVSLATALVEITKFKIRDRDFYSAYHHICRSEFLELKSSSVEMYRLFVEGVIFLMKRKTTEGLANLNKLQEKYPQMDEFLLRLFFLYRAYGYFVSSQHEKCLEDYTACEKHQKKDRHAIFNMLIAQGIVEAKNSSFDKAVEFFNKAQALLPNKIEPYLYRSVNHVLMACKTMGEDEIKRLEVVFLALKELDKAYDLSNSNSNQLFLRGLIYYYLGKINEGLEDIGKAISKSEENIPKYFFYRGLGQGTLKNYKQCINDLTICINLDENYAEAYLERGKVFFLDGHSQKAVDDIAKYSELTPSADKHAIEGNLYFSNADYEEALKRFEKSADSRQSMSMRVKCCIVMGDYQKAELILSHLNELHSDEYTADLAILQLLQVLFKIAEDEKNVDPSFKQSVQEVFDTLTKEPKTRPNGIFSQLHLYHYLGVCNFYLERYEEGLVEFSKAHKERQLLNIENDLDYKDIKNILNSQESQNEDVFSSDREFNQINYNIFLCYIKLKQYKKAYELFIRDVMPAKENLFQNELLTVFSRMIFQAMRNPAGERALNESAISGNPTTEFEITLFDNVLSSGVPYTTLELKDNNVRTKLCLLLPNVKANKMLPEVSSKDIILRVNLSEVENKPEPPWVKRSQEENLVFTDDIQSIDNIEFNTEENQEEQDSNEEGEQEQEGEEYEEEESERPDNDQFNIEKIKQAMKLDDSIEQKLNKLIGRGKKPEE